jgi:hypothetical protein
LPRNEINEEFEEFKELQEFKKRSQEVRGKGGALFPK